ncbi:hypothetical protein D2Q93_08770 [Alicyclobacillaceae bacterium I2511]|nr:hypothetical protein D2Q93_08770 [Alicyclobacillaceae bacterium I2511]
MNYRGLGGIGLAIQFSVLLLGYTGLLLLLSQRAKQKAATAGHFFDGGRGFGTWRVFVLMTAMWGASMFSVELDTGFSQGMSAVWFGISTIVASLFIACFLLAPFRKIQYLTNSNLIGQRYGTRARDFAALVIGLTFPIFAMKNVLAAASFLHVILGWSLPLVLIATTVLVIAYVSLGGMWSLAYVQVANLAVFSLGLGVAAYFVLRNHPVFNPALLPNAQFSSWFGVGPATILVWFGMSLLNSVSAQAEFQTIAAAKSVRQGRLGVLLSSLVLVGFAVLPVLMGMAAREGVHSGKAGLLAFPVYLTEVAPHWAVVLTGLGFWSAALIWCAPLLFSGASSFGLDLFNRRGSSHHAISVRRLTRWSMVLQGAMIVLYALARPGQLAWWAVFGLTLRNAAIVGPTVAFLLWPLVREKTVLVSMVLGVGMGFTWNAVTGFSALVFPFGINPMWVGTGTAMLVLIGGTFLQNWGVMRWAKPGLRRYLGGGFALFGGVSLVLTPWIGHSSLHSLLGCELFLAVMGEFFAAIFLTEPAQLNNISEQGPISVTETMAVQNESYLSPL